MPSISACQRLHVRLSVPPVNGLKTIVFFLVFTVLLAAGLAKGVKGEAWGWWLMILSLIAYLGLFIKFGCRTSDH